MGLTNQERINFNSKVLAANIQDGVPSKQWYEGIRGNFFILEDGQVLTQFSVVRGAPAANLTTARNNVAGVLSGIVEDLSQFTSAIRLTEDIASNGFQYIALATYNDFSSARLDKWVQPQKVPQANGQPSIGYSVQLYDGDPASGGTLINTSDGQTGSGNTASVGWIFNYDTGTLLLSEDFKDSISDPYIVGFRYIGDTVADLEITGGGDIDNQRYFFTTTQTAHGYPLGSQLVPVYKTSVSGWIPAQANSTDTLAVGFITNALDADTLEITLNGRVTVSGHSLLTEEYYFLSVTAAGDIVSDTPISGVVQPVLWVEDDDIVIVKLERPNELTEEPEEVIERIQGLEISVSGLEDEVSDLEARADAIEFSAVTGGGTATGQVTFLTDASTVSGVDEFHWNNTTKDLTIDGNIVTTGTVDGRDVSSDGTALDTHTADSTIHFIESNINHTAIQNIGTNTHIDIDTHIADDTIHFTEDSIDHGSISGLDDDDHTQYVLADGSRDITGDITVFGDVNVSGIIETSDALSIIETSTTPADIVGRGTIFIKSSDSKIYFRDDSGTEYDLTQGVGTSDIDGGSFDDTYINTNDVDGGTF